MIYFVSGIDTDAGKTVVTGLLARSLQAGGVKVVTQKFIQTGCRGISEDILRHREIMGTEPLPEDRDGTTCPYVMSYPASPHLAAEIDGVTLDVERIVSAAGALDARYGVVLLEGAGGLYVPVRRDYFTIDFIQSAGYPLILVSSSKLGSINHTLMSLELCRARGIRVAMLVYNHYPNDSREITEDSVKVFRQALEDLYPDAVLLEVPVVAGTDYPLLDIASLLP